MWVGSVPQCTWLTLIGEAEKHSEGGGMGTVVHHLSGLIHVCIWYKDARGERRRGRNVRCFYMDNTVHIGAFRAAGTLKAHGVH